MESWICIHAYMHVCMHNISEMFYIYECSFMLTICVCTHTCICSYSRTYMCMTWCILFWTKKKEKNLTWNSLRCFCLLEVQDYLVCTYSFQRGSSYRMYILLGFNSPDIYSLRISLIPTLTFNANKICLNSFG